MLDYYIYIGLSHTYMSDAYVSIYIYRESTEHIYLESLHTYCNIALYFRLHMHGRASLSIAEHTLLALGSRKARAWRVADHFAC